MRKFTLIVILGVIVLSSCKKGFLTDCRLISGEIKTETRNIGLFNNISLNDNVNIIFTNNGNESVMIEAGANLIDGIITNINSKGVLEISNSNQCDWARSYDTPVNVYLNSNNVDTIQYRSIGNITSQDTIVTDSLRIIVSEGAGTIELTIDVFRFFCELHYGTADIIISGKSNISALYSASFGLVNCGNLQSGIVYVNSRSSNDVYVNSTFILEAEITSIGNIYYKGNPEDIKLNRTGSGELIHLTK